MVPIQKTQLIPRQNFNKLINSLPGIIITLDTEGYFTFVNKETQIVLGYTEEDLSGKFFIDILSPTEQEKTKSLLNLLKIDGNKFELRNSCIKKNGEIILINWVCRWDPIEQMYYCMGSNAKEKMQPEELQGQFERKIKEHNQNLLDILERIEDGFIAVDELDKVIYWNKQAEIISGKTREEVLTRNIFDCYPDLIKTPLYQCHQKAKIAGIPQHYEAYYPDNQKWIEFAIYPSSKGVTSFIRDITQKKTLEEKLEVQKKEHQKKLTAAVIRAQERERAYVGIELHDNVNQVLTTVKLYTELSISNIGGTELMEKSKTLLQGCIDEIRYLSKQLSAPTLGKIRMKDSILELGETITATGKTSISIDMENIQDLEVIPDMHLAIYRILQEHLTNIIKHADASEAQIKIYYLDDDLVVKVTDNGVGFNIKEKKAGIGISNMISRVESLGGRLSINSSPGIGCVLIAYLPTHKETLIQEL